MKTSRRHFLGGFAALPSLKYFSPKASAQAVEADNFRDYYHELGVEPFINAIGPYSSLGGAFMWPEVIDAMDYAIDNKARMTDIHDAVGKRIAQMLGAEAAMVTSGATGAIILGTAACMTMGDPEKNESLPNTSDMANEVIILRSQRYLYDRSIRAPGAKLVEVEHSNEVADAINEKTAMLFFLLNRPDQANIDIQAYIRIAKQHDIPIMCDAATTVPPIHKITDTVNLGFDLICYSGGKGLRGPYSAGLLLGRKDLIHYARQHGSPNHRAYGRSMKVAPEEYLGMMVAVETSLKFDEEKFSLNKHEIEIMKKISEWPRCIEISTAKLEPHRITFYLYELATLFHSYWNMGKEKKELRFISKDKKLSDEKLVFLKSISTVIKSGMNIVGVDTPEKM